MRAFAPARLRAAREHAGLSRAALGDAVNLSMHSIKDYETARRMPSVDALLRLANALGCSPGMFFELVHDVEPDPALAGSEAGQ